MHSCQRYSALILTDVLEIYPSDGPEAIIPIVAAVKMALITFLVQFLKGILGPAPINDPIPAW